MRVGESCCVHRVSLVEKIMLGRVAGVAELMRWFLDCRAALLAEGLDAFVR